MSIKETTDKAVVVLEAAADLARNISEATGITVFKPELAIDIVNAFHALSTACPFVTPVFAVAKILLEKYKVRVPLLIVGRCMWRVSTLTCHIICDETRQYACCTYRYTIWSLLPTCRSRRN